VTGDDALGGHPIYRLDSGAVTAAIENAIDAAGSGSGRADAVLVAGTGAPTVEAFDRLRAGTNVLLLSSNVAAAWWLLTASGHAPTIAASAHPSLAQLPVGAVP
jgi:maleate cis-trans isomerase